jgi:hypothetical protein
MFPTRILLATDASAEATRAAKMPRRCLEDAYNALGETRLRT